MITTIFESIGFAAIAAGGLLAAFLARRPSKLALWATAYLVLIVGLVQIGLAYGWSQLQPDAAILPRAAMVIFDLGNALVMAGTIKKYRKQHTSRAVSLGGGCLGVAMIMLLCAQNYANFSWTLIWYLALIAVVLISMPIGLMLSARRARN